MVYSQIQIHRQTLLFRYERVYKLLTSVLWHEERDIILTMLTPSQRTAHLVLFNISVCRDPKTLTAATMVENSILYAPMAEKSNVCLHGPMSTFISLFFKILKFLGPSLPGMTSFTFQPHFLSGGLLWQWWLSYPLRTSVKLHPITMPWTKWLEYFKDLPNWMIKYNKRKMIYIKRIIP